MLNRLRHASSEISEAMFMASDTGCYVRSAVQTADSYSCCAASSWLLLLLYYSGHVLENTPVRGPVVFDQSLEKNMKKRKKVVKKH
jgi:hypothetical protein